jgi:hypothetical protein
MDKQIIQSLHYKLYDNIEVHTDRVYPCPERDSIPRLQSKNVLRSLLRKVYTGYT